MPGSLVQLEAIRREVSRCRAALAGGSSRPFWVRRLQRVAADLRAATALIEQQLVELGELERHDVTTDAHARTLSRTFDGA